jgi:hypothetical protein
MNPGRTTRLMAYSPKYAKYVEVEFSEVGWAVSPALY